MQWSLWEIWNKSLDEDKQERPLIKRDHIWATELGGSYIDRFLKMNGVAYSNKPNSRSLRKFEAGNIWESIIKFVLIRAGILQSSQEHVSYQYPDALKVTGKLDFIAGGHPTYDLEIIEREFQWLPPFISRAALNIVNTLEEKFPEGLGSVILEVKSCSSFMFENYERFKEPDPKHALQDFHYLKAKSMPEGHVVYVCKDDARLLELEVQNPSDLEEIYYKDIMTMTDFIRSNTRPPLEDSIVWKDNFKKFAVNWKVEYSNYLTMLYGFKTPDSFHEVYDSKVERWNRVLTRVKNNEKMTDNNKEALDEIVKEGFDLEKIKKIITETTDV